MKAVQSSREKVVVIGAGPSGLGVAYALKKLGQSISVVEQQAIPGGLCRTINFNDYLFDIGGHRFITSSKKIRNLWQEILGKDLIQVKRVSRVYYNKRFFDYPLTFSSIFYNLSLYDNFFCFGSYILSMLRRRGDNKTLEEWLINRFGKRLYKIFFKDYSEKIWGVSPSKISAHWAEQRIRGLSLKVVFEKFFSQKRRPFSKTLYDSYLFPKNGSGDFYARLANRIDPLGDIFSFYKRVKKILHHKNKVNAIIAEDLKSGEETTLPVDYLFSSMPLPQLIEQMRPRVPEQILRWAQSLQYRNLLCANIILNKRSIFSDQWLYIQSPHIRLGRIQNYKNWSKKMVPNLETTSLCLEYFCSRNDVLFHKSDQEIINHSLVDLERIGIASRADYLDGFVVRSYETYPIYSLGYESYVTGIKNYLDSFFNLKVLGRAGCFSYDNADQALLLGITAGESYVSRHMTEQDRTLSVSI